ncbi:hypothetical protein RFI_15693, partial [Reticulomyxa filosa]
MNFRNQKEKRRIIIPKYNSTKMHPSYHSRTTAQLRHSANTNKTSTLNSLAAWTTSVPKLSDDFGNESFSGGLMKLKVLTEWMERQSDVLSGILTATQVEIMSQDMNQVYDDVKQGFDHLQYLITHSSHSSSYSQDKARLQSLQQQ